MSIVDQIREEEALALGRCPKCQRVLTHWRGRHTGRWVTRHVAAMCELAERESEPAETRDEARDAWIAGKWAPRPVVDPELVAGIEAAKPKRRKGAKAE